MASSPPPDPTGPPRQQPDPSGSPTRSPVLASDTRSSTVWLQAIPASRATVPLGSLQLAWLGDAVWELHQRLRHCQRAGRPASLHRAVVATVRADAQSLALERLMPMLREAERDQVRQGRNRAGRGPRGADAADYGRATGFETMLGWLFLRDPQRLAELLERLEDDHPPSPPHDP